MDSSGLHYKQGIWCTEMREMAWFFVYLESGSGTYLCQEKLYRIEKGSGRLLPTGIQGWPLKFVQYIADATCSRSIWQLSSVLSPPVQYLFFLIGMPIGAAYSSCGRTNILYATSLMCRGDNAKLC